MKSENDIIILKDKLREIEEKIKIRPEKQLFTERRRLNKELRYETEARKVFYGLNVKQTIHFSKKDYRNEYLKTEHWKLLRDKIRLRDKICKICFKNKICDVHHLSYDNLYNEKDEQLIGICRSCHNKVHAYKELSKIRDLKELRKKFKKNKTRHQINFDDVYKYNKITLLNQGRICNILDTRSDFRCLIGIKVPYKKWIKIEKLLVIGRV